MSQTQIVLDPFSQMINPEAIFSTVRNSERLSRLKSRIFRLLDKPSVAQGDADVVAFDDAMDQALDPSDETLA